MPSTIRLPHRQQEFDYSCLPACARMILAAFGREVPEAELRQLLKTRASVGTHTLHFRNLDAVGFEADWPYPSTLNDVRDHVERGLPVVVFLWTGALKHWPETAGVDYLHTAVAVGFTDDGILLHDPKFLDGPTEIPLEDFLEAWRLADHMIALIRLHK